ncbi:MAG: hypothetical protein MPJ24_10935 [Pirellulaceae bacterium]|nr:hypothetical protein [Pirellulaceae bacterium]
MNSSCDSVAILANPKSGSVQSRDYVGQLQQKLKQLGYQAAVIHNLDEFSQKVESEHTTLRAVVSAGGDGTAQIASEITQGRVPIAILPLGTENLLSRYLKIPRDPNLVAKLIDQYKIHNLDSGFANGKLFLLMVSVGFDAEVVKRLHTTRTGNISRFSYIKPLFSTLWDFRYPEMIVQGTLADLHPADHPLLSPFLVNDETYRLPAGWLFFNNLPFYALGLQLSPKAIDNDGWLDVCLFVRKGFLSSLYNAMSVFGRWHSRGKKCLFFRVKKATCHSEADLAYQYDGDFGGKLPLDIQLSPFTIPFLVP